MGFEIAKARRSEFGAEERAILKDCLDDLRFCYPAEGTGLGRSSIPDNVTSGCRSWYRRRPV